MNTRIMSKAEADISLHLYFVLVSLPLVPPGVAATG
jgi:hypothetical protein